MSFFQNNKIHFVLLIATFQFIAIISKAQLVANFSGTPTNGCAPVLVNFKDSSTGNPVSYQWDLGNGTQSTLQNPSTSYFTPGNYTISLIVTNALGIKDTAIKNQYITVNAKPVVDFSASTTLGCYPLTTQFTDLSTTATGTNIAWLWDFGDGTSSTLQNPIKTYSQGTFTVVLRVTNDKGCSNTIVKTNYIRAINGINAGFTYANPNTCTLPVNVSFTNTSTGTGVLSYNWNFGDGGTSTAQNPVHSYTTNGSFNVTLVTTNDQGCSNTYNFNNAINIGNNNASFTGPNTICEGDAANFTNTSTPQVASVLWHFGDGTTSTQLNPSKIYTTPGTYTIKLVSDFGTCKDSTTKNITVLAKPIANFTAPITTNCKVPFTVNFSNTSSNGVSYQWNFGDGNNSNNQNPSHTYTTLGQYTVSLIVTNSNGCIDTVVKNNFVRIQAPSISFLNLPDSGCRPLTITPLINVNSIDGIASYNWNFGDGFTTNSANPSHAYNTSGVYTISLIVTTNGGCVDSIKAQVKIGTKPNAQFAATPNISCAFTPIQFTDTSNSSATFWFWQFGDGSTSYEQNPIYNYQDTGFFSITLIMGNNGCYDTLVKPDFIYVKPPISIFLPNVICATPFNWTFTDNSIAPLTWAWNFGDGQTSTLQHPTHNYAASGWYNVSLTVTNGSCVHLSSDSIHVINETPNFIADTTKICKNASIVFTTIGLNRQNISSFVWDFGDGIILPGDSVITHKYTQSGTYTVSLTIIDINGCSKTATKNLYITVYGPTANFNLQTPGACINSPVIFNDLSTTDGSNNIINWAWNYGDGAIQNYNAAPFIHQYTQQGIYSVLLSVTDTYGCKDSVLKTNVVTLSKPLVDFTTIDTASCPNRNISFNNFSTGNNLTYNWNFGDGNTSTQTNPIHQYTADGNYSITLIAIDQYGCSDTIVRPSYINIVTPFASFSASDTFSTCPPLFVQFTNQSLNYTSLSWDFGDGATSNNIDPTHFYTNPGIFVVKLTASTSGGCVNVYTKTIRIQGPTGTFNYNPIIGCAPLAVSFNNVSQNATSYVYDFNNGQTVSTSDTTVNYIYTQTGKYLPRIILKDNNGCSIPIYGIDSITVYDVQANIQTSTQILCDSGRINFNANAISNDIINSYTWNFGDGNTGVGANPVHNYTNTGAYVISCITTTMQGCRDTSILNIPLTIAQTPMINFTTPNGACLPATASFAPQIIRNDTSTLQWNWNFGNGQTSNQMLPPNISYTTAGIYTITAIAITSSGCSDTVSQIFNVWALPIVDAGVDKRICKNSPIALNATGALNYTWSPSQNLSCANCPTPNANPDSTKTYYVLGADSNGCLSSDSVKVEVVQPLVIQKSPDASFCVGGLATLQANGANSYVWSPSAGLSSTVAPQVVAKPTATTTYMVVGSDAFNCFKDTGYIVVKVNPIPVVNAGADVTISVGTTTILKATATGNIASYVWTPANNLSCTTCPTTMAQPLINTTYNVEVTTDAGCKSNDDVTVFLTCDNGNLFVPNTFSPNGDGMNDIMYPRGNGIYQIKTFKIFSRWGELIYEQNYFAANDPTKGWDGSFKGKRLTPDVFVYLIEVLCTNKTPISFKGNITLVK